MRLLFLCCLNLLLAIFLPASTLANSSVANTSYNQIQLNSNQELHSAPIQYKFQELLFNVLINEDDNNDPENNYPEAEYDSINTNFQHTHLYNCLLTSNSFKVANSVYSNELLFVLHSVFRI